MRHRTLALISCAAVLVLSAAVSTARRAADDTRPAYLDPALDFDRRAADLVSRMTLDEKVSQLQNDAPAIPRLDVPAYEWWNEVPARRRARRGRHRRFRKPSGWQRRSTRS